MLSYKIGSPKRFFAVVAFGLISLAPASAFAADFEGNLDFFKGFDWETVHKDVEQKNNGTRVQAGKPGAKSSKGPFEVTKTTEVTIKLEKKMPAMQGSSDKPFLGPDPMEADFEDDPFATKDDEIPVLNDPLEGINRSVYNFNDTVYDNLLKPVAETYSDLVHEEVRIAVRNLFNNALAPVKFVSSVVQLNPEKAGRVVGRTLLNTVFGWGGMLDVAGQEYGIKDVNEDFNQALGYYGVGTGPYIVLPFLDPPLYVGLPVVWLIRF